MSFLNGLTINFNRPVMSQTNHKIRGEQLLRQQKYEQAIVELTKSLNALNDRFNNSKIKDDKQARHLIKTVKLPCLKTISQCQFKLDKLQQCEETCNKILKIDNDCAETIFMKGSIKLKNDNLEDALTLFQRVCFLEPQNNVFQKTFKEAQLQYKQKHNLSFSDRQVARIAWSLGWIVSLFAYGLALIPYFLKVVQLVFQFFVKNGKKIFKAGIRLTFKKIKNTLWYFYAGFRSANKSLQAVCCKKLPFYSFCCQKQKQKQQKLRQQPKNLIIETKQ